MVCLESAVSLLLVLTLCLHTDSFLHSSLHEKRNNVRYAMKSDQGEAVASVKEITSTKDSSRTHRIDFVSPLLEYGYRPAVEELANRQKKRQRLASNSSEDNNIPDDKEKPILLYLPGFDGTYICPFIQFPELSTEFEIWCMTITMEDRSTYKELKAVVLDFMKNGLAFNDEENNMLQQNKTSSVNGGGGGLFNTGWFGGGNTKINEQKGIGNRPIYIAGESFGGILALDVASTILAEQKKKKIDADLGINLKGLVLINPATCYDRSQLAIAGPKVATTPSIFYILRLFSQLVPLFTDEFSFEQLFLILQAKALPSVIDNPSREAYMGRVAISLPTKLEFMPSSTLSWRLEEWLENGCVALGESSLSFRDFQSLIVVGENDKTLPSIAEAERLASKVMSTTKTQIHVVDGAGHASTCGSRLDLAAVIRNRFPELQKNTATSKRTSMKPLAKQGVGANFGMEKRYDKADFGLNPFLYWSKNNYLPVQQKKEGRSIRVRENQHLISYKKTVYKVAD